MNKTKDQFRCKRLEYGNRKSAVCLAVVAMLVGASPAAFADAIIDVGGPLKGTAKPLDGTPKPFEKLEFRSAVMQGDGVSGYLRKMKTIMTRYTDCVFAVVMGNQGKAPSQEGMTAASAQTQILANEIADVKAPAEIAGEHENLAKTLQSVDTFIKANSGAGPGALPQALQLIATVQSSMFSYHNGAQNLIQKYGLPATLDPLGGDQNNQEKQQQLTNMMGSMKDGLMMQGAGGAGGAGALDGGGMFGGGGTFGAGGAFGGGGTFGGSGTFGGAGTFGGTGTGIGTDTTGGANGSLDLNGLMKQMSGQNEVMQQLLGE